MLLPPKRQLASKKLSPKHPGSGRVVAALSSDAARPGGAVRATLTAGVQRLVELLASVLPGRTAKARRRQALASFAGMVGAVVLARAVSDEALSDEILEAVSAQLAQLDARPSRGNPLAASVAGIRSPPFTASEWATKAGLRYRSEE